ncbi:MAG: hypothetical protein Q7K54_03435 [Candidatus Parcubacteria bacterium]|nr:hypothetical protein [Candidatus Parcubacteria bacterium]
MKKNKLVQFVHSLVLLPIMSMSISFGGIENTGIVSNVLSEKFNIEMKSDVESALQKNRENKAEAIDAYFKSKDMPLAGTGMKMVLEAEKNELDWRLIPAIAVRESTGGKNDCNRVRNNVFGWGSCKIGFKSIGESIEIVAWNLGGNNPNTERHYDNKTTKQILRAYNPPSIIPNYVPQVMSIMKTIGDVEITLTDVNA